MSTTDSAIMGMVISILISIIIILLFIVFNLVFQKKVGWSTSLREVPSFVLVIVFVAIPIFAYFSHEIASWLLPWVIIGIFALSALFTVLLLFTKIKFFSNLDKLIHNFWNWDKKSFSGVIVADYANTLGVLGGLGAYTYFKGDDNLQSVWWWIGIFGAFLAMVVSFASWWRFINLQYEEHSGAPRWLETWAPIIAAVTNLGVGIFVVASLMVSEKSHDLLDLTIRSNLWFVFLIEMLVISFIVSVVWFVILIYKKQQKANRITSIVVLGVVLLLLCVLLIISIVLSVQNPDYGNDTLANIFGIISIGFWITAELLNCIFLNIRWHYEGWPSVYDYLGFEKSAGQFVGGLLTGVYLFLSNPLEGQEWIEAFFIAGANLGTFGTLRGIARGFLNRSWKLERDEREREREQEIARERSERERAQHRLAVIANRLQRFYEEVFGAN